MTGTGPLIRPMTSADRSALANFPSRVSARSAIFRFHGSLTVLTDKTLDLLLDLVEGQREAITAVDDRGIAGVARFAREAAMLPFVGHQDRNLGDGRVQVVAREPGHAGDAAVINGSDGFPLAVDEVEQEVQGLVREHGDRSVKPEDGTSGRDPVREVRQGRAVGRRHRADQRACAGHGLLLGCGDHAVSAVRQPRARRTPESDPAGGSRGVHAADSS